MNFEISLKETVQKYGLAAQKSLGQNFLLDQNVTEKIIKLSLEKQGLSDLSAFHVFEVGPGPGGLTRAVLSQFPKSLTVVEADPRCVQIMTDLKQETGANLEILYADALEQDFSVEKTAPRQIVSNLPYHISVPLLLRWLKTMSAFSALTLMFQKEVAERILAPVKTKSYGRISVLAQLVCHIDKLLDLNPACFVPPPKIWSSVLLFRPCATIPNPLLLQKVEKLTSLAFGQRRKMIRQSLKSVDQLETACQQLGIKTTSRAEELSPAQYLRLAEILSL